MSWFDLVNELEPSLRAGDLAECDKRVSAALASQPSGPFHLALDMRFTNAPEQVAEHFDRFIRRDQTLAAVYTETNGFDINPKRWFFELFGYRKYGGVGEFDWIAEWDTPPFRDVTLTGMERLQKVYASRAFKDKKNREAADYASLLVVVRFQQLIQASAPMMGLLSFPLLATSHDYDFIYEYRPGAT